MTADSSNLPAIPSDAVEVAPDVWYPARITPLRNSSRRDVEVVAGGDVAAFDVHDIVRTLREFFADIDAEAAEYRDHGDPVALTHALARMEALLADVRYVRDQVRDYLAGVLDDARIRRLTVQGVATMEGTGSIDRSGWQHKRLMAAMFQWAFPEGLIDPATGERFDSSEMPVLLLEWFTPSWKLTPIRAAGLNPDDYCTVPTDEDGKAQRTPAVRIVDNHVRKPGGTP